MMPEVPPNHVSFSLPLGRRTDLAAGGGVAASSSPAAPPLPPSHGSSLALPLRAQAQSGSGPGPLLPSERTHMATPSPSAPIAVEPVPTGARGATRIYVVEDQPLLAQVVERLLTEQKYEVRVFRDGLEGYAETCLDPPDLLVVDVLVPSLQGLAMTRLLKFNEDYADLPILVMSSITEGMEEGVRLVKADAFLPKPFEADAFLAEVARLVASSRRRSPSSRAAS